MSYPTPMDVAEAEDKAANALDAALDWPYSREVWDQIDAERVELLAANEALAAELAACKMLKPISHDDWYALCNVRDALNARLTEAMRLLAKEGIHMDDHGCWCNPSVTNHGDACTCHMDDGPDWRVDCPAHGFMRATDEAGASLP
jgi:hypothetical protein